MHRRGRGAGGAGPDGAAPPPRRELPFESFDAFEQRLDARARLAARDAHDRDLEHQARVGDGLLADVDDRLTEDLDARARRSALPIACASAASFVASSAGPS